MKPVLSLLLFCVLQTSVAAAEKASNPLYKPSNRSPLALDILSNDYGASRDAPGALGVGETVPDFVIPKVGGGSVSLQDLRKKGSVAIIFYRGHW